AAAISPSDAYQLASYAQAYQAPQAWLVYPVQDDTQQPKRLRQLPVTEALTSKMPDHATLWLIPFNVNTGTINKGSDLLP
ncbi:MAG: McrC family protein, partial [Psychrobacter celer]